MASSGAVAATGYQPTLPMAPTLSQVANVFMLAGVLVMLALLAPEVGANLLAGRIAYTIWASLVLVTPALCLYALPNPTWQRLAYANLFYAFAYLAYLPHFYYTVFAHFGGFAGMWRGFSHPIAISNLVLTVWWPVDAILAWRDARNVPWLRVERLLARVFVFMSFFLSAVIFMPGPVKVLGALMTACVGACVLLRLRHALHEATPGTPAVGTGGASRQAEETTMGNATIDPTATAVLGTGVRFTETMRGYFSTGEVDDYARAAEKGRAEGRRLEFTVTITTPDIDRFVASRDHAAAITGTVACPALSAQPLVVTEGRFNLFVDDASEVNARRMRYAMKLAGPDGATYHLEGFKAIRDDRGFDVWRDTTTLYTRLYEGSGPDGALLGVGILEILPADFMHQLTTMQAVDAPSRLEGLSAIARFGKLFTGALYDTYGGVLLKPSVFDPDAKPRERRPLDAPAPEVYRADAGDGVALSLTRYRGGSKGPLMCVHGLGVNSAIFSTDLIDCNLVEALVAAQYDVWLLDFRSSIDLPYAARRYTADDVATKDFPAAVKRVREITGAPSIQCLVHCFGATTFFMAMLAGLEGVRSAGVSQIATHMRVPASTRIKALFHAADFLDKLGVQTMTAYVDTHERFLGRLADRALELYPVHDGPRDTSPVSRRISFLYGQLYEIDQLNQRTYDNLHELFGVAAIASLEHLGAMIRAGHIVDFEGRDTYLQHESGMPNLGRLAIPMLFVHGAENKCWDPVSTQITVDLLGERNGTALYDRQLVPGYGHIDCIFGKDAHRDVYPRFVEHFDRT